MSTTTRTPAVCPGTGSRVEFYKGTSALPGARCPVCYGMVQVYKKGGSRYIGTHERREQ